MFQHFVDVRLTAAGRHGHGQTCRNFRAQFSTTRFDGPHLVQERNVSRFLFLRNRERVEGTSLFRAEHFQNVARRHAAQRVKSVFGKMQPVAARSRPARRANAAAWCRPACRRSQISRPWGCGGTHNFKAASRSSKSSAINGSIMLSMSPSMNVGQVVKGQFDAVVGHAVLRKIVGADAFVALAGADLLLAAGGVSWRFPRRPLSPAGASAGRSSPGPCSFAANARRRNARSCRSACE